MAKEMCTMGGIIVTPKEKSIIEQLGNGNSKKELLLAAYLKSSEFKDYWNEDEKVKENGWEQHDEKIGITIDENTKVNLNTAKRLLRAFYLEHGGDITRGRRPGNKEALMGFSDIDALNDAKDFVLHYLFDDIDKIITKRGFLTEDKMRANLIKDAQHDVRAIFVKAIKEYIYELEDTEETRKLNEIIAERRAKVGTARFNLKQANEAVQEARKILKESKKNKLINRANAVAALNNAKNNAKIAKQQEEDAIKELFNIYKLVANNSGNIRLQNLAALYNFAGIGNCPIYASTFNSGRFKQVVKGLNKQQLDVVNDGVNGEEDSSYLGHEVDDEMMTHHTSDNSMKGSYDKAFGSRVKMKLATIPVMESYESGVISTSPYLGTTEYLDYKEVIHALVEYGYTYGDLNQFILSIERLAKREDRYAGLKTLVEYMRNPANRTVANAILSEFNGFKVSKSVANLIPSTGVEIRVSNPNVNIKDSLYYKYLNASKGFLFYNNGADIKIYFETISKSIDNLNTNNIELLNAQIDSLTNSLVDILKNIIPAIDAKSVSLYIRKNISDSLGIKNQRLNNIRIIKDYVKTLLNEGLKINAEFRRKKQEDVNRYKQEIENNKRKDKKEQKTIAQIQKEFPWTKTNDIEQSKFTNTINRLVDLLKDYSKVDISLNSRNAQGNMGSDVIGNSYLSGIIKMIAFGTDADADAGIKMFKDLISKVPGYKRNHILFDQYDENGNLISKGMFHEENGNISINSDAKSLLKINLFSGIMDVDSGDGQLYYQLSATDYLVTKAAFFYGQGSRTTDDFASYFMRTPSDAQKNYTITTRKINSADLITERGVDRNHRAFAQIRSYVIGEIEEGYRQLGRVLEKPKGGRKAKAKKDLTGLFDVFHYKGKIIENGKLTGRVFSLIKLFPTKNGFNAEEALLSHPDIAFLVDGKVNNNYDGNTGTFTLTDEAKVAIDNIIEQFILAFDEEIRSRYEEHQEALSKINTEEDGYTLRNFRDFIFNDYLAYCAFDDLFEGNSKFYKDAQTSLKRAKECQAGGTAYADRSWDRQLKDAGYQIDIKGADDIVFKTIDARTGFRGITIKNVARPSKYVKELRQNLVDALIAAEEKRQETENSKSENPKENFKPKITAAQLKQFEKRAEAIIKPFKEDTITDDGISYITLDEFVRRRSADGTLEQYLPLLAQLYDPNISAADIDLEGITARITMQKNFYFDHQFDSASQVEYPRQIKNAEVVLIPKLLPEGSSLRKMADMMERTGIDQINTQEANKAAIRNVVDLIDENGEITNETLTNVETLINNSIQDGQTSDLSIVEDYYYSHLYKQGEVSDHYKDVKTKLGIQLMKKIFDNTPEHLKGVVDEFQKTYCKMIQEDFNKFLDNCGWKLDDNGKVVDKKNPDGKLSFKEFYRRVREEAERIGMDSNFMDYVETDEYGVPIMPNWMGAVAAKFESVAQSMINSAVIRQKVAGWHSAQMPNVGRSKKLRYHPATETNDAYIEIALPRWSSLLPEHMTEEDIKQLEESGLDIHLGYRIPTEGKQSMCKMKVVEILDEAHGASIVIPDEWVTQTGSDFDIDTIYGLCYNMKRDENGKLVKVDSNEDSRAGRENKLLDCMLTILTDPSSREENLSRSHFSDIKEAMAEVDVLRKGDAGKISSSTYNTFDQVDFMENATAGIAIKGISVNLDTFLSLANKGKAKLNSTPIRVEYDLSGYTDEALKDKLEELRNRYNEDGEFTYDEESKTATIVHSRIGWSNDNKNFEGEILTVYSSQTTAHILDAIKTGAIYNETIDTFEVIKMLANVGVNYKTIVAFIEQPAITELRKQFSRHRSVYDSTNGNAINNTVKNIAKKFGITKIGKTGRDINNFSDIKDVIEQIEKTEYVTNDGRKTTIGEEFYRRYGVKLDVSFTGEQPNGILSYKHLTSIDEKTGKHILNKDTDFLHQLAVIQTFAYISKNAKAVNALVMVSKPDKYGARQTIRGTRQMIANAQNYSYNSWITGMVSAENAEGRRLSWCDALYPGIATGKIRETESFYPYQAQFMKCASMLSVEVNSQLFPMESKEMIQIVNEAEAKLGVRFNDEQYRDFQQYAISYLYSLSPLLNTLQTINGNGFYVEDEAGFKVDGIPEHFTSERRRIYGYTAQLTEDFKVKNINKPTQEEIDNFARLTPAQKVAFIQKHFQYDAGIFGQIEVNLHNQREQSEKGYSAQTLRFNDEFDIERALIDFQRDAVQNNPFARLAAIDIVKYAFIVDGFRFRKNGVGKIINNEFLLRSLQDRGLNLINELREAFNTIFNPRDFFDNNGEMLEWFIRSHSNIIKHINVDLKYLNTIQGSFRIENSHGLLRIPYTGEGKTFLMSNGLLNKNAEETITTNEAAESQDASPVEGDDVQDFPDAESLNKSNNKLHYTKLRIKYYQNKKVKYKDVVYRVEYGDTCATLIPLNKLEENEVTDISVNPANNEFASPEYYEKLMAGEEVDYDRYSIKNPVIQKKSDEINNPHLIESDKNPAVKDIIKEDYSPKTKKGIVGATSLNRILQGRESVQEIDGVRYRISPYKIKNGLVEQILKGTRTHDVTTSDFASYPDHVKRFVERNLDSNGNLMIGTNAVLYQVTLEESIASGIEAVDDGTDSMYSVTGWVDDAVRTDRTAVEMNDLHKIAESIASDILKRARRGNKHAREAYANLRAVNLDLGSADSIITNTEQILAEAAKMYKVIAEALQAEIQSFKIGDDYYRIDDDILYERLAAEPDSQAAEDLMNMLLNCLTVGRSLGMLSEFDIGSTDGLINDYLHDIVDSINSVKNNPAVLKALGSFFDIYVARRFSSNPLVQAGVQSARVQFGDLNSVEALITSISQVANTELQTIVSAIFGLLNEADALTIPKAQAQFRKEWNRIMSMPGTVNFDKFIKDGKFIPNYITKFLEDRDRLFEAVAKAEEEYGRFSVEYYEARLARDKWLNEHTHQRYTSDYYRAKNDNLEFILNNAPELFVEYQRLIDELHAIRGDETGILSDEDNTAIKDIRKQIAQLFNEVDETNTYKSDEEFKQIQALRQYTKANAAINNKYFKQTPISGWENILKNHLDYLKDYEEKHPTETLVDRLKDAKYKEAYDWIALNTTFEIDKALRAETDKAFTTLKDGAMHHSVMNDIIASDESKYKDEDGVIIGTEFNDDQVAAIKRSEEARMERGSGGVVSGGRLIRNNKATDEVYTEEFYKDLYGDTEEEVSNRIKDTINEINSILEKGIDKNGVIQASLLYKLPKEELKRLGDLYKQLRELRREEYNEDIDTDPDNLRVKFGINDEIATREINKEAADEQRTFIYELFRTTIDGELVGDEKADLLFNIFMMPKPKKGAAGPVFKRAGRSYVYNPDMYARWVPKDSKYIDTEKTEAKRTIDRNVSFIPTEYYYQARREAANNGTYDEWFVKNHVYDSYTRQWKPLRIWTKMEYNFAADRLDASKYKPSIENSRREVADESYLNSEFGKHDNNYNGVGYDNGVHLNDKEKAMLRFMRETSEKYANTEAEKRFVREGMLPRMAKHDITAGKAIKNTLNAIGYGYGSISEREWEDSVDYDNDTPVQNSMLRMLRNENMTPLIKYRPKLATETDEEYKAYKKEVDKQNEVIKEDNRRLESPMINDDWFNIFQDMIGASIKNKAKERAKLWFYVANEELKRNKAYKLNDVVHTLRQDKVNSTDRRAEYVKEDQRRGRELLNILYNRVIRDTYKRKSGNMQKVMNSLQNLTSANYMMLNYRGGIANVTIGITNMMAERFAGDNFAEGTLSWAFLEYFKHIPTRLSHMNSPTSDTKVGAVCKAMSVVDFDAINQLTSPAAINKYLNGFRNLMYSPNSMGEDFMQNIALLAVLKSNKLFTNIHGRVIAGNFNEYWSDYELKLLHQMVIDSGNTELLSELNSLLKTIKSNPEVQQRFVTYREDIVSYFLRSSCSKSFAKEYIKKRDEAYKTKKEEWKRNDENVYDQLDIEDGIMVIKEGSRLTGEMVAKMKQRAIEVNNNTHGVYNRIEAAALETRWYGSVMMQYKKHLYPGIMRRFRRKGYWDEHRGAVAKGSWISVFDFLTAEFRKANYAIKDEAAARREMGKNGYDTELVLKGIQNYILAFIDTFINFKFNYKTMARWERANIKRHLADAAGFVCAVLGAMALNAIGDDDDDDDFLYNLALYEADRLATESMLYTIFGMTSEAQTQAQSGNIAAVSIISDVWKGMQWGMQWMYDENFDPIYKSGVYKGENKFKVILKKNTPILHVVNQTQHMKNNNRYYHIGNQHIPMKFAKYTTDLFTKDEEYFYNLDRSVYSKNKKNTGRPKPHNKKRKSDRKRNSDD